MRVSVTQRVANFELISGPVRGVGSFRWIGLAGVASRPQSWALRSEPPPDRHANAWGAAVALV